MSPAFIIAATRVAWAPELFGVGTEAYAADPNAAARVAPFELRDCVCVPDRDDPQAQFALHLHEQEYHFKAVSGSTAVKVANAMLAQGVI